MLDFKTTVHQCSKAGRGCKEVRIFKQPEESAEAIDAASHHAWYQGFANVGKEHYAYAYPFYSTAPYDIARAMF